MYGACDTRSGWLSRMKHSSYEESQSPKRYQTPRKPNRSFKNDERETHVAMGRRIYDHYQLNENLSDESRFLINLILIASDILEVLNDDSREWHELHNG